jgi:hypothetical protein
MQFPKKPKSDGSGQEFGFTYILDKTLDLQTHFLYFSDIILDFKINYCLLVKSAPENLG